MHRHNGEYHFKISPHFMGEREVVVEELFEVAQLTQRIQTAPVQQRRLQSKQRGREVVSHIRVKAGLPKEFQAFQAAKLTHQRRLVFDAAGRRGSQSQVSPST